MMIIIIIIINIYSGWPRKSQRPTYSQWIISTGGHWENKIKVKNLALCWNCPITPNIV